MAVEYPFRLEDEPALLEIAGGEFDTLKKLFERRYRPEVGLTLEYDAGSVWISALDDSGYDFHNEDVRGSSYFLMGLHCGLSCA